MSKKSDVYRVPPDPFTGSSCLAGILGHERECLSQLWEALRRQWWWRGSVDGEHRLHCLYLYVGVIMRVGLDVWHQGRWSDLLADRRTPGGERNCVGVSGEARCHVPAIAPADTIPESPSEFQEGPPPLMHVRVSSIRNTRKRHGSS